MNSKAPFLSSSVSMLPSCMKATLQSKHHARVAPFVTNGVVDPATYKTVVKEIHTACVKDSIDNLGVNRLLAARPPKISSSESSLSRAERTTLAQLRTSQCKQLNDYKHSKLNRAPDALCPECLFRRHNVSHIFDCDARPTDLTVRDLWSNPVRVANFLKTLPSFSFLLPPDPPPPPPPPLPDPPP